MAVRTHYDRDYDIAVLAAIVILQAAIDDLQDDVDDLTTNLAVVDAIVDAIIEDTEAIREVTDSEAILTEIGGTLTTDGTEQNLYINNSPAGIFEPLWVNIDFTNHTGGETVVIRTYHRNVGAGAWIRDDANTYAGIPTDLLLWIELHPTRFGVRVTIEKTVGTDRDYIWEAFYKEAP